MIFGLIFGLITGLTVGLPIGLILGLIDWWKYGQTPIDALGNGLSEGFVFGLIWGVIWGLIRLLRVVQRDFDRLILTVESIEWSWQHLRRNLRKGGNIGLTFGLFTWLSFGLASILTGVLEVGFLDGLIGGMITGLTLGLIFGLIVGLMVGALAGLLAGLFGGFQSVAQELKTRANQGTWLTIQSSVKSGIVIGFVVALALWLFTQEIAAGLAYGIITFFIIAGWYGGLDAIEHGIVRLIITRRGHTPLNYARFLDYAAEELHFLQKVGGGYVFIHRYLLEHFADMAVERGYVTQPKEE